MGLEDLDFSTDTPKEGQEQGSQQQSQASGEQGGYPTIKEGEAEFFKIPRSDYEALQKQSMKGTQFDQSIAEVTTLRDQLQQQIKALEAQVKQPGQTKEEKQEKLSEIDALKQEIADLKKNQARQDSESKSAQVEKELASFKGAHKDIFTGNAEEDAKLTDLVCAMTITACNVTGNDNFPMEDAYKQFLQPYVEDAIKYRALQKKKQASMDMEGNASSSATGVPKAPTDEAEASDAFAKAFYNKEQ